MIRRIFNLPKSNSFFLFGARGTGKTTLLNEQFDLVPTVPNDTLLIDLLNPDQEESYGRNPRLLFEQISADPNRFNRVIIDEVQKLPTLLDVVHTCIEKWKKIQFILTGSSARKLKHGGANLLGGRVFSFNLYPLTSFEAPNSDNVIELLSWGTLPKVYEYSDVKDKRRFLKAYTQTYLREEIQLEHIVRDIIPFREFLDLAAQSSGEIINFRNISLKSGVDERTIARYFEILVDTLIGYFLEPFNESVRVRQSQKPKFFLFDTGIQRHLTQMSDVQLKEGASEFGKLFEQWIICECIRLNEYFEKDFKFYFLRTKDGAEIDLIVQKPGKKRILIEIKSTSRVEVNHMSHLIAFSEDIDHEEKWVICNEKTERLTETGIRILPWRVGLERLFF